MNIFFKTGWLFAACAMALRMGAASAHGVHEEHAQHAAAVKEQKPWGIAADAKEVTRTIAIRMLDTMRFVPDHIDVKEGEAVRIEIRNEGQTLHELVIGTQQELKAHAQMMLKHPSMQHDEPYMSHVPAGQVGQLLWRFNRAGQFDFACLIPGHHQAGMVGTITVAADTQIKSTVKAAVMTPAKDASVRQATPAASPAAFSWSHGKIRRLDLQAKKITLQHGPLENLGMDAMTMVFQLRGDQTLLAAKAMNTGDEVEFVADYDKGAFVITQLRHATAPATR